MQIKCNKRQCNAAEAIQCNSPSSIQLMQLFTTQATQCNLKQLTQNIEAYLCPKTFFYIKVSASPVSKEWEL